MDSADACDPPFVEVWRLDEMPSSHRAAWLPSLSVVVQYDPTRGDALEEGSASGQWSAVAQLGWEPAAKAEGNWPWPTGERTSARHSVPPAGRCRDVSGASALLADVLRDLDRAEANAMRLAWGGGT